MKLVKLLSLVLVLTLFAKWSTANENAQQEPHSIPIKATSVQGVPKTSSILASINGHALSVVFTENFGQVFIEVTDTNGGPVDMNDMYTPTATTPTSTMPAATSSPSLSPTATCTTASLTWLNDYCSYLFNSFIKDLMS